MGGAVLLFLKGMKGSGAQPATWPVSNRTRSDSTPSRYATAAAPSRYTATTTKG